MIKIGRFEINCDKNQFIVKEMRTQTDKKSKRYNEEYCYNETYYPNTEQVVSKLLDEGMKDYINTSDFGAALSYMQNVKLYTKHIIDLQKESKK